MLAPEAKGANLLLGVNYASAGAGILEDTGSIFVRTYTVLFVYCFGGKVKQLDFIAKNEPCLQNIRNMYCLIEWLVQDFSCRDFE